MTNQVLSDSAVVYYAVFISGRPISQKFTDRFAAEQYRQTLGPNQQKIAEVQVVSENNQQLLLG